MDRREVLRWGAVGAAGAMLSSAASSVGLPSIGYAPPLEAAARIQLPDIVRAARELVAGTVPA